MSVSILENLKRAVRTYDEVGAAQWATEAIEAGIDPVRAFEALTDAIRQVGEEFGRGELFLPDLMAAAAALQKASPILEKAVRDSGGKRITTGKVVIGTVHGDVHNIGKTMVCTLLTAVGFEVVDLGVNVEAKQFIEAVKEHRPEILAMSALLTTVALEQKKVIEISKQEGLREGIKVMVGGGAISEEFARSIGADGYEATAPGAVDLANQWMGQ